MVGANRSVPTLRKDMPPPKKEEKRILPLRTRGRRVRRKIITSTGTSISKHERKKKKN